MFDSPKRWQPAWLLIWEDVFKFIQKIYKRTWSGGFETTLKNDPERVAFSAEDLSPYATSIARAQTSFEEGGGKSNTGSGRIYKGIDPETGMPIYEEE